eukprot:5676770-Amphidinium_carterae.1
MSLMTITDFHRYRYRPSMNHKILVCVLILSGMVFSMIYGASGVAWFTLQSQLLFVLMWMPKSVVWCGFLAFTFRPTFTIGPVCKIPSIQTRIRTKPVALVKFKKRRRALYKNKFGTSRVHHGTNNGPLGPGRKHSQL